MNSRNRLKAAGLAYEHAISRLRELAQEHAIREVPTRGFAWKLFLPQRASVPEAGWKLHVSISTVRAEMHVSAVCEALLSLGATFKLPATLDGLIRINSGQAGITQVGKAITVYPGNDDQLQLISRALKQVSYDPGPHPPSDYVVEEAPGQSIRWGAFGGGRMRWTTLGRPYVEIPNLQGGWKEDSREPTRTGNSEDRPLISSFRPDLAVADGPLTIGSNVILPLSRISHGPRARVDIALRTPTIESCILKRAREKVAEDLDGNCSSVRLLNEARILGHLSGAQFAPSLIAYSEDQNALVMSDELGTPIDRLNGVAGLRKLIAACDALALLHENGIIHRDAKLANAIWSKNGKVVWIDFEIASQIGNRQPIAAGTHGYIPPEGTSATAHPSYDVFAIGASLAKWCIGIDPSRLPLMRTRDSVRRLLRASGQLTAEQLYLKLTDPRRFRRPSAAIAVEQIRSSTKMLIKEKRNRKTNLPVASLQRWANRVARKALPALSAFETPIAGSWRNNHIYSDVCCSGVNIGSSGILIGLMHLADSAAAGPKIERWVRETAENLSHTEFASATRGFFTGYTGAAVALAVAGARLRCLRLTQRATELLLAATRVDDGEVDLFSGDAGVLFGGAHIARITRDEHLIKALKPLADRIRKRAIQRDGVTCWKSTSEYDPERKAFLGAAHGAAGIALGLISWAALAQGQGVAAQYLAHRVLTSIWDVSRNRRIKNTPETIEGTYRPPQYWCHGVAGYLWCLLQCFPNDRDLLPAVKWANDALDAPFHDADLPTLCHGMAGMLEVSTMSHSWATQNGFTSEARRYLDRCNVIAYALRCTQQPFAGARIWSSEDPSEITPDLWIGFLGPVVALTRFSRGLGDSMISGTALSRLSKCN